MPPRQCLFPSGRISCDGGPILTLDGFACKADLEHGIGAIADKFPIGKATATELSKLISQCVNTARVRAVDRFVGEGASSPPIH